ncbi:MAG: bifunctional precorrin-2 dehydrogenase/sirohydrochlorin ferrochelatase [Thermodesulfobacteria bacterium]|nr:bifunctional precorrin-2 dehydrogenase/sirohydrochlorin ferrochelatase [Thermodesulfobacteriota bacterium]
MEAYYPIFLRIEQKRCVVIGGGKVALRKIKSLLSCGARVVVIAPEVLPEIEELAREGKIELIQRPYQEGDLEGAFLVVAATNNPAVQEQVVSEAERRGLLLNVVDQPERSNFIVPSVIRRGRLSLAISTSGASPALARRLRETLEELFGPEYADYLELMARWRREILSRDLPEEERRQIFEQLALLPIPLWIKRGEWAQIEAVARNFGLSL